MRKIFVTLSMVVGLTASFVVVQGCNPSWWQQVTTNPVEAVQEFEAAISVAVSAAQLAWPAILPSIPVASQAQANTAFENALSAVNHAEQALNDGVNAAVIAQQSNPDFTALMQAVSDAVGQVVAIIDEFMKPSPAPVADAGAPPAPAPVAALSLKASAAHNVADLHASYSSLSRWGVRTK
jgi:hypothetical protein